MPCSRFSHLPLSCSSSCSPTDNYFLLTFSLLSRQSQVFLPKKPPPCQELFCYSKCSRLPVLTHHIPPQNRFLDLVLFVRSSFALQLWHFQFILKASHINQTLTCFRLVLKVPYSTHSRYYSSSWTPL